MLAAGPEGPMTSPHADVFRASLKRCLATPDFLHDFYELFMAASGEVRQKFRNTDFPRQTRVLADSLFIMAVASESKDEAIAWKELDRLAERHSRAGLDIRPELYDVWLECLLNAARLHDPPFPPEVEAAWRQALGPGIEHLRSRY
jgi:hemoglobin-like flavoprotein